MLTMAKSQNQKEWLEKAVYYEGTIGYIGCDGTEQ
jgi:hypothetical protein